MAQAEYLTEIFYPSRFYDFMSPVLLNYLAALHGFAPRPLAPGFTYCELGCGGGATVNTLAAAYPRGRFYGVDLNPAHIDYARRVAESGELANIEFVQGDFRKLDLDGLPDFDFITLHGIYSWVSPETRRSLLDFLRRKLRPGGLCMVSYNAMPGSALIQPLRDMLLAYTGGIQGARAKVAEGIKYLRYLSEQDAAYFRDNPAAKEAVDNLLERDRDYLAHEFFNAHWTPFYFTEVAQDMAQAGLSFVGGFPISANYLESAVPEAFLELFQTAPDRIVLERHKAFVRNERFRRDVYVKAEQDYLPEERRLPLFAEFYFGTEYSAVEEQVSLRRGDDGELSLDYSGEPCRTVMACLQDAPRSLAQLSILPELRDAPPLDLLYAVNMLVLGGYFRAFAGPAAPPAKDGWGTRIRIPSAFNRRQLETCLDFEEGYVYLASPVAGDGIPLGLLEGLLLLALAETGEIDAAAAWAWARMEAAGRSLQVQADAGLEGEEAGDPVALLGEHLTLLVAQKLGKYLELGLVAAA